GGAQVGSAAVSVAVRTAWERIEDRRRLCGRGRGDAAVAPRAEPRPGAGRRLRVGGLPLVEQTGPRVRGGGDRPRLVVDGRLPLVRRLAVRGPGDRRQRLPGGEPQRRGRPGGARAAGAAGRLAGRDPLRLLRVGT